MSNINRADRTTWRPRPTPVVAASTLFGAVHDLKEVPVVKPPLYLLALPRYDDRRRPDDRRRAVVRAHPAWPVRWSRKLVMAVPASARVFRRQMATPLAARIDPGTPVQTSAGRHLGVVRSLVVEVGSGGASYAVAPPGGGARIVLLPHGSLVERNDVAILDERVMLRLRVSA